VELLHAHVLIAKCAKKPVQIIFVCFVLLLSPNGLPEFLLMKCHDFIIKILFF